MHDLLATKLVGEQKAYAVDVQNCALSLLDTSNDVAKLLHVSYRPVPTIIIKVIIYYLFMYCFRSRVCRHRVSLSCGRRRRSSSAIWSRKPSAPPPPPST
jgi:hypothetical protein